MNLSQRYNAKSNKRFIRFAFFYAVLIIVLLIMSTNAKYISNTPITTKADVAEWKVSINDIDATSQEVYTGEITLVTNSSLNQTTTDNKLAPGKTGYFDIILDPTGTEVSIEYTISFDLSNLPEDLKVKDYTIIEDSTSGVVSENSISGEILLNANKQPLSASDKKTLRVNWEWEDKEINQIPDKNEEYKIEASILVKQKIN